MATVAANTGYGRMRRRIAVFSKRNRNSQDLAVNSCAMARDRYVRVLLRNRTVTHEQLDRAIGGFNQAPSDFSWLAEVDESVLDKADHVFAARYGKNPIENDDFSLSGDYHKICRSLEHDLHHYDDLLSANPTSVCTSTGADTGEPRKPRAWAFGAVLVAGFCSAPLLGMLIVTWFPERTLAAGLVLGSLWLVVLVGALARTLPH